MPVILGCCVAAAAAASNSDADDESPLGAYRGLYCYVRDWSHPTTGAVIIVLFILFAVLTLLLYMLTTLKVAQIVKNASGAGSSKAPKAIMKRGLLLTATFVATWIWFITLGGLAWSEENIDINID